MSDKLLESHKRRDAYVYVRQSTMHQVRNNVESKQRQYDLAIRAKELGFANVVVIDEDLGVSGSGVRERRGFSKLLAAICQGSVGAVFAIEASRLARNNREWHHLVDLCALTETLVVDHDGIYDPKALNDRLLLGLKGTMSEFELSLLRTRAQEALKQKIRRGDIVSEVPIGYMRAGKAGVELTPDRRVRDTIKRVFSLFRRLGSVRQVLLWHRQEKIELPSYTRNEDGVQEVVWRLPVYNRVLAILQNPIYAGAFVYGRTCSRTSIVDGVARKTAGHRVQQKQWDVVIKDHHAGFISWEEFVKNQEDIAANTTKYHMNAKRGAAKKGPALLAGLLRCRRCGRMLHVGYSGVVGNVPRYYCRGANINHGGEKCISFGGTRIDQAAEGAIIDAIQPANIGKSIEAWDGRSEDYKQKLHDLETQLQNATYEVGRAFRQYNAVDPENRLVAADLERRWNESLANEETVRSALEELKNRKPPKATGLTRLLELSADLKLAWNHPRACVQTKKRLIRALLNEIVVDVDDKTSRVILIFHWAGERILELRL